MPMSPTPEATCERVCVLCCMLGDESIQRQATTPKTISSTAATVAPTSESELVTTARPPNAWRFFFFCSVSLRSTRTANPSGGPTSGQLSNRVATWTMACHSARQVAQVSMCCSIRCRSRLSSNPSSASDIKAVILSPCAHSSKRSIVSSTIWRQAACICRAIMRRARCNLDLMALTVVFMVCAISW